MGLDTILIAIIDLFVLFMCLASFLLCCRALVKGHLLKIVNIFSIAICINFILIQTTCEFFERAFNQKMPVKDKWEFFNLWYGMIVLVR
jgi:mucolipin